MSAKGQGDKSPPGTMYQNDVTKGHHHTAFNYEKIHTAKQAIRLLLHEHKEKQLVYRVHMSIYNLPIKSFTENVRRYEE